MSFVSNIGRKIVSDTSVVGTKSAAPGPRFGNMFETNPSKCLAVKEKKIRQSGDWSEAEARCYKLFLPPIS